MKKVRFLIVEVPIWGWDGVVLKGGSKLDMEETALLLQQSQITLPEDADGYVSMPTDKVWLLWIKDIHDIPSISHEVLHITARILRSRGIKMSDQTEEAYTYTQQYILEKILKAKQKDWKRRLINEG